MLEENGDKKYGETPEVEEKEKVHAESLLKEITETLDSKEYKEYVEEIKKNRLYAKGKQHDDDSGELVRANLIHSEIKSLVSTVYAKDPDIAVTPTEAVTPDRYPQYKQFGKTLELVLVDQFSARNANLKAKAKSAIRSGATSFIGWVKVAYQKDYETDPEIANRMRDVQDDIERMKHLSETSESEQPGEEGQDPKVALQELEQMMKSLEAQPEIVRAEGLVIDKILSEDMLFSADVQESDSITSANKLTQRIWMTVDKCVQHFGFCPTRGTRYSADHKKSENKVKKGQELVCIFEQWNMVDNRVYTLMDGWHGYMREPFTPTGIGERFHGYFPLILDPVDGEPYPLCLVSNLRELQDEHNESRTNFRHHRKYSIPMWIGIEGKITQKDANKIKNAESMEVVLIEGDETQPIENYIHQFQNPVIDPSVYMTDHIREDWELVTRRGDAARGSVAKAKTATEASILQQGLNVDSSEAQDTVEEWLRDISQYSAELCLQEMSPEQAKRIAGEQAQWPQMSKEQIFDMVGLEIRAGSSGKPDKAREQEQWLKFLPELRETLLQIVDFNSRGGGEQSEILKKLIEETLRRFDEKIDIEEYIPREDEQAKASKEQAAAIEQKKQAIQERTIMREMIAKINNLNADSIKKIADAEGVEIGQQLEQYMADLTAIEKAYNLPTLPGPTAPPQQAAGNGGQPPQPPRVVQ